MMFYLKNPEKISVLVFILCQHLCFSATAPPSDLECKSQAGFQYCEGKSNVYSQAAEKVGSQTVNNDLLTRSRPNPSGGQYAGGYGFMPSIECDRYDQERCEQMNAVISPTFLLNHRDQPRYILQWGSFQQRVRLAICTNNVCSYGRASCDQQYATVQMLAWDPEVHYPQLMVDRFRVPSCCRCRRSGFFPGGGYGYGYGTQYKPYK